MFHPHWQTGYKGEDVDGRPMADDAQRSTEAGEKSIEITQTWHYTSGDLKDQAYISMQTVTRMFDNSQIKSS